MDERSREGGGCGGAVVSDFDFEMLVWRSGESETKGDDG